MDKIYGGFAVLSVIIISIVFLFGKTTANGFIQLVFSFFDGIISIVNSILSLV